MMADQRRHSRREPKSWPPHRTRVEAIAVTYRGDSPHLRERTSVVDTLRALRSLTRPRSICPPASAVIGTVVRQINEAGGHLPQRPIGGRSVRLLSVARWMS